VDEQALLLVRGEKQRHLRDARTATLRSRYRQAGRRDGRPSQEWLPSWNTGAG
jgi:hypothetical protein